VRRFKTIYGRQVEAICGKTTETQAKTRIVRDEGAKMQVTNQDLTMEVMHVASEKFLISICMPLGLLLVCYLQSQSAQELGQGVQKYLNTLRSRGFDGKKILVDPHKSFESLQGSFPGVEIDPSGAGDHQDKIDAKIRQVKELRRSVVSGLPYKLPKERIKDLVTYAVGRLNLRKTEMLMSAECPRVRFMGQRPDYSSELGLAFGDYIEAYNPKAHARSNDVFVPRTEPCIALYLAVNTNRSWVMFNLNTKSYLRRSQWRKCTMSDNIVQIMNGMAGETGVQAADILDVDQMVEESDDIGDRVALHHPVIMDMVDDIVEEEADPTLPELEDAMDDESDTEDDDDESETGVYLGNGGEDSLKELYELLEDETDVSRASDEVHQPPLRRSERTNAGVKKRDEMYDWSLMNLSVSAAQKSFGGVATDACKDELLPLFVEKEALIPVKWESLSEETT